MAEAARRLLTVVALLCVAAVSGCGTMPDSGPAGPGRELGQSGREPLRVAALGPRPGAGPEEIVGGFLRAGAASDDDQGVARGFLVGAAVRSWQPSRNIVVYPDDSLLRVALVKDPARSASSPVQVEVTAPVQATIDDQGRFVQARPGTRARAMFTVARAHDGWRVSEVEQSFGSWLPQFGLDRTFSALPVSFVAAGTTTIVPDLRWLPGPRRSLATELVRQLLHGPPAYLGSAVVTGFPRGTTLAVEAVPTTAGIAQVDLSAQALTATPAMRRMMWAQLTTTLRRLPSVAEVRLTVAGAAFEVPGVTSASVYGDTAFREDVRVSGPPFVLSGDHLIRLEAVRGGLAPTGGDLLPPRTSLRALSVGPRGSLVVGVDSGGRQLVMLAGKARPRVLLSGANLIDPVIDPTGSIWTADSARPGRLQVLAKPSIPPSSILPPSSVIAPLWLVGRTVHALDVSRDGARVLVVSSAADGARRAHVAGVVRGADGQPRSLAAALEVGQSLTQVTDAAWADRSDLVVIGRGAGDARVRPYDVVVGGPATALAPVAGAVAVAAGDGLRAVYVTTAAGQVMGRSGTSWVAVGAGRSVSVPQ